MSTQSHSEDVKFFMDMVKSDFPEVGKYINWIMVGFASLFVFVFYIIPTIRKFRGNSG